MTDEASSAGPGAEQQLPTFEPHERVCGNCKLWRAHSLDQAKGWVGNCRVQPNRGLFKPSAPLCDAFVARGENVTATVEAVPALKRAKALKPIGPVVRRADGTEQVQSAPTRVSAVDPS